LKRTASDHGAQSIAGYGGRYRLVEMAELSETDIARWLMLRASNSALASPYFHPGFTAAVAATRNGVRLIIGEDESSAIISFLPVQLDGRTCRPAGSPAADFQGPICEPRLHFEIGDALRACGISYYEFDHLRDGIPGLEPWIVDRQPSPYVDISGGVEGYMARAHRSGKHKIRGAGRLSRKAGREYGEVRFVAVADDATVLETVIDLKRRQFAATGARDYFGDPQHVQLMHHLLGVRNSDFGGMLSVIYAGQDLVAAHFGMRAGHVLHWWFPVYDPRFSRLDPGWMLLRSVIEAAPELGLTRIDLGRGSDEWKRWVATGQEVVCQGMVTRSALRRRTALAQRTLIAAIKSSRAAPALRGAVQVVRRRR
jgi:CelD/BcsL family acetyltransferase involved in cellulose biosynthesis